MRKTSIETKCSQVPFQAGPGVRKNIPPLLAPSRLPSGPNPRRDSKAQFRQFILQFHLEGLQVGRGRFVALLFGSESEAPELVQIPGSRISVTESHAPADQ